MPTLNTLDNLRGVLVGDVTLALTEKGLLYNFFDHSNDVMPGTGTTYEQAAKGNYTIRLGFGSANPTYSSLTAGTTFTDNSAFSVTNPSLTFREIGCQTFIAKDDLENTTYGAAGMMPELLTNWSNQGAVDYVEAEIATLFNSFTTYTAGSSGVDLSESDFLSAMYQAELAHLTSQGIACFLHTRQWYDIAPTFADQSVYGQNIGTSVLDEMGTAARQNYKSRPYGVPTYTSTNIIMASSNRVGWMGIKKAIFFCWYRRIEPDFDWKQQDRGWNLLMNGRYMYGEASDGYGVRITTDA